MINNKQYVRKLRADKRIQKLMDEDQFSSAQDVITDVLDADQDVGDSRIYDFYVKEQHEIDQESYYIEDNGDFYGLVSIFDETILNPNWQPGSRWLMKEPVISNDIPF